MNTPECLIAYQMPDYDIEAWYFPEEKMIRIYYNKEIFLVNRVLDTLPRFGEV